MKMQKEKLILSLIKDDLLNTKLILGLNQLGLQADNYSLRLGETVFQLLDIAPVLENAPLFERYLQLLKGTAHIKLEDKARLDVLVANIYEELRDH